MSNDKKKVKVATTVDLQQALAAGFEASQIEIDNASAIAAARAEGVAEGKAQTTPDVENIRTKAIAEERARIAALNGMCRPGFEAELKAAIEAGDSAEKFGATLWRAAMDRGITLDAIRKDAPDPVPHAKTTTNPEPQAGKSWDDVHAQVAKQQRM